MTDDATSPAAHRVILVEGSAPLASAAALALLGERFAARCLATAAAFATPPSISALAQVDDPVVSDALAAAALSPTLNPPLREAAAAALERGAVTAAVLAALAEIAEGPKRPPWSHAVKSLDAALARSETSQRQEAERTRHIARQLRAGEGAWQRRIAYQRDIARGAVHPIVAALIDANFLTGIVAPIEDDVAPALIPLALLAARSAQDPLRGKALALIQRRWSALASLPLSAAVRESVRPKDEPLRAAMIATLGTLGAVDALMRCVTACAGATRGAALEELARLWSRAQAELPEALLRASLARAEADADGSVSSLARSLTGRLAAC